MSNKCFQNIQNNLMYVNLIFLFLECEGFHNFSPQNYIIKYSCMSFLYIICMCSLFFCMYFKRISVLIHSCIG